MTATAPATPPWLADLPHLSRFLGQPMPRDPWRFGHTSRRAGVLASLPDRVWQLVLCDYAVSVEGLIVRYYPEERRPQDCTRMRMRWCLEPSEELDVECHAAAEAVRTAQVAAWTAQAAQAATWATWTAPAAWAARAARAARAAGAALAACQVGAALAAQAVGAGAEQWRYMRAVYLNAKPLPRSRPWQPSWNTSTVVGLASSIYDSGDFGLTGILADALEDAGCDDGRLLARCRDGGVLGRSDVVIRMPLEIGG